MLRQRFSHRGAVAGAAKRTAWLLAVAVPAIFVPVIAGPGGVASAAQITTTTCSLGAITVQDDNGSLQPGSIQLTVQDSTVGLKHQISPYHANATRVFGTLIPGTTAPVTSTFTQQYLGAGSSGSLQTKDMNGNKNVCLGQFKGVIVTGADYRADSIGFTIPYDRNWLVVQNSSSSGLTSFDYQAGSCADTSVTLMPGQLWMTNLANPGGTSCLGEGTPGSPEFNQVTVTPQGPAGATAEVVLFGNGPFVYGSLPQ